MPIAARPLVILPLANDVMEPNAHERPPLVHNRLAVQIMEWDHDSIRLEPVLFNAIALPNVSAPGGLEIVFRDAGGGR